MAYRQDLLTIQHNEPGKTTPFDELRVDTLFYNIAQAYAEAAEALIPGGIYADYGIICTKSASEKEVRLSVYASHTLENGESIPPYAIEQTDKQLRDFLSQICKSGQAQHIEINQTTQNEMETLVAPSFESLLIALDDLLAKYNITTLDDVVCTALEPQPCFPFLVDKIKMTINRQGLDMDLVANDQNAILPARAYSSAAEAFTIAAGYLTTDVSINVSLLRLFDLARELDSPHGLSYITNPIHLIH